MICITDFITIEPSSEILLKAIDYGGRSIHFTYDRMAYGSLLENRIIRIVVGIVVERAFEDYLREQKINFDISGRTHWRIKDSAEFIINEQKIDIKGYHVYPRPERHFPQWFLPVEGLVPYDQLLKPNSPDIFVQAFLVSPQINRSSKHNHIVVFSRSWSNRWREARRIEISADNPVKITLHGEGVEGIGKSKYNRCDTSETFLINPGKISISSTKFSSLQYLSLDGGIKNNVSVKIENNGVTNFSQEDWIDVWLDKPAITFAAWGTKEDYKKGQVILPKSQTTLYSGGTRTKNFGQKISNLRPIKELWDELQTN